MNRNLKNDLTNLDYVMLRVFLSDLIGEYRKDRLDIRVFYYKPKNNFMNFFNKEEIFRYFDLSEIISEKGYFFSKVGILDNEEDVILYLMDDDFNNTGVVNMSEKTGMRFKPY